MGYFWGWGRDKTVLGSTHEVEQHSFSTVPPILTFDFGLIVTAQQQPQPQQQDNHNCSWVESKQSLGATTHHHHHHQPIPTTTGTQNYMIEQK